MKLILTKIKHKTLYYLRKILTFPIKMSPYIKVGNNFNIGYPFRIEPIAYFNKISYSPQLIIGDHVHIENNLHLGVVNKITIGNNVVIASNVFITDHNHGFYDDNNVEFHENPLIVPPMKRKLSNSQVLIGNNVWIGENVSILPNTDIGEGSIIASNSVIKGKIDSMSIYAGIPARKIKYYDVKESKWKKI